MARRNGLERFVMSMAREAARQQKSAATRQRRATSAALAEERRVIREAEAARRQREKHHRETEREQKRQHSDREKYERETEREHKRQHVEYMEAEVAFQTRQAAACVFELESILAHTLHVNDTVSFDSLRVPFTEKRFHVPAPHVHGKAKPTAGQYHEALRKPSGLAKLIPGATRKFAAEYDTAKRRYEDDLRTWERSEKERLDVIEARRVEHDAEVQGAKAKAEMRDAEVDAFQIDYFAVDPDALIAYNTMVLERSVYPEGFPQHFSIAYTSGSKMLVIEYELPTVDVVPRVAEFRYVRTRDVIEEKARKPTEIRAIYQDVIASIAPRTLHEVFEADQADCIEHFASMGSSAP